MFLIKISKEKYKRVLKHNFGGKIVKIKIMLESMFFFFFILKSYFETRCIYICKKK